MKWNKSHIILAIFLPIQMFLMQIVAKNPEFIEQYYSIGIYPYISSFFRIVGNGYRYEKLRIISLIFHYIQRINLKKNNYSINKNGVIFYMLIVV